MMKSYYSSSELLALKLDGMPTSKAALLARAQRESWSFKEVKGIGGTRRLFQPPSQLMTQIQRRAVVALVEAPCTESQTMRAPPAQQLDLIATDKQLLCAQARKGVLATIDRIVAQCGVSREAAMTTLVTQARMGTLDDSLVMMLRAARDPRGRRGDGFPDVRTIKKWRRASKVGSIVPKKVQADLTIKPWLPVFLKFYQTPQKPSLRQAYYEFAKECIGRTDLEWKFPTIYQVRRFLGKLGNVTREVGRMGSRELKNIRPFVRRSFDKLLPNDVWSGDGHKFDAEVQHPLHGRPFRPEITAIADIATRRAVGFSIALAESGLAVLSALSSAVGNNGCPAIFYVDNGSGYRNDMLSNEGTGMAGVLGFELAYSLPYNSQARGVIERLHKTLWVRGAKLLPSYMGSDMDREARQANFKITRDAIKNGGALPLIGWEAFLRFCNDRVAEYNASPHSLLPKIRDPETGLIRHMSPDERLAKFRAEGWEPTTLTDNEMLQLFRPRVERTVRRGEIELFNNRYFSAQLEEFHRDLLHVAYDVNDASCVWVYHPDGRFICKAEFGANEQHYFPMSVVEQAREKRADAREKRVLAKLGEIEAERRGYPALEMDAGEVLDFTGIGKASPDTLRVCAEDRWSSQDVQDVEAVECAEVIEMEETPAQRFARWQVLDRICASGGEIEKTEDLSWYRRYQQSREYAAQKRRLEEADEFPLVNQG